MESRFSQQTNRPIITIAVLLCLAMGSLEGTVVATAMPKVTAELHGIDQYAWVTSIYLLTSTVLIPIYGKLSDLFRRRLIMILGICVFLLGSMLSGLAQSMEQLIIFRAIQGIGAGGLQSLAFAITADLYTAKERARIQGIFGATWAISGFLGSFLGGIIVNKLSWHWIFFMNIPVGLLAILLLKLFLHEHGPTKIVKLDLLGAFLLSGAIITLLLGAEGKWPLGNIPLSIGLIFLFIWNEKRTPEPLLPLSLLSNRVMGISTGIGALIGCLMVSTITYLSLLLQGGLAYSATKAGLFLAPVLICWPLASTLTGWFLPKIGYRPLVMVGFFIVAVAAFAFALLIHQGTTLPVYWLRLALAGFGVGLGIGNTTLIIAVQEKASPQQRGVATASMSFSRSIGSAVGVGALGALLNFSLKGKLSNGLLESLVNPMLRSKLAPEVLQTVASALTKGLEVVFWGIAVLAAVTFIIGFFFPGIKMVEVQAPGTPQSE